ncbi:E3 ubiquitin-protein ligase TRIM71-like [Porites lutea]|uniref:E3 ubiquitin-protein ligase TRIM71-like n=1 Tax=Porites lutea TaxID=51062 RepID=UPI003CC695C7
MDVKTLLDNLHDELSCSVCMCTYTDPKQLPYLHSFCLHCLNGIQRTSGVHGKITCPECRKQIKIPGSGNPSELPTNFRINSLVDVFAIKECNTANVKCGNCEKRSAQTLYCFQCCSFWCEECILAHNVIRTNREHKTLALKDFQDQDIEAVLRRPVFCQKELHEKEELKFFCKNCEVAICSTCAMTLHEGHGKMLLQEATNARKTKINSMIKSLKDKVLEKRKEVEQFNQKSMEVQAKVADVKRQVQTNVDQMTAIIEARKQHVFDAVDNQAKKSIETLSQKKGKVENQVKIIESAIEQTESLMKRNFSTEILGFNETFDKILDEQESQGNRDNECIPRFSFTKSEKLINVLNSEGIGNVKTVFSETKAQQSGAKGKESSKVIDGNKAANVPDSALNAQLQTRSYRPFLSFGQEGKSIGMLKYPLGVAVNDRDEIAVTELCNSRVSVFSSDGTHLRSFGREGQKNGEFKQPSGIAFDSVGNIVVADCYNHRMQLFDRNGKFLRKFGKYGTLHKLKNPEGLSLNGSGHIVVTDRENKLIKIFTPSGEYLRKFGGAGALVEPYHCIQHGQYFIVSDYGDDSIKMFDLEGKFISKFGKQGNKDGEFNEPCYLSVNKQGLLMVCDAGNHRVQVFELSGKFVTKFGSEGSGKGEFNYPVSTACLSDGRIVVSDVKNDRIQIFDQI